MHPVPPKNEHFCSRKMQQFVGGQNELTLATFIENSAWITTIYQTEDICGNVSLQASSCIHSYPKEVKFCRKVQFFVGAQKKQTLVTLSQNRVEFHQVRKNNVSADRNCLACDTVNSCQSLRIRPLRKLFLPIWKNHSTNLPPAKLYFWE